MNSVRHVNVNRYLVQPRLSRTLHHIGLLTVRLYNKNIVNTVLKRTMSSTFYIFDLKCLWHVLLLLLIFRVTHLQAFNVTRVLQIM